MFYLVEKVGLLDELYKGNWKKEKRHGYGIQLFPDGSRFIGNWKRGKATGFGRLEFTNNTSYEGNFFENKIQEGTLRYYNGTVFEGWFDGEKELFRKGIISFADGERFKGVWSSDGIILNGYLVQLDKKRVYMKGKTLIRNEEEGVSGKIIYWNKGIIYEGGLSKGNYDRKGYVYGNYQHPFYLECNYNREKNHGRYLYHSFYYGFNTEENYKDGKEIGTWRYCTVKGYEYIGETSTKKQIVRFPFLNNDYYEGEVSIWTDQITLVSGVYNMLISEEETEYKQIRVINCKDILKQKEIVKRYNNFEEIDRLIKIRKSLWKRAFFRQPVGRRFFFENGTQFYGHIVNDYLICHKNDFLELYLRDRLFSSNCKSISTMASYYTRKSLTSHKNLIDPNTIKVFKGTLIDGQKQGYCHVEYKNNSVFRGFFVDGKKQGFGFYFMRNRFNFIGYFSNDQINGKGVMRTSDLKLIKGNFKDGLLNGLGVTKYLGTGLEYFGELLNNLRKGKGVLKFNNKYKFEGYFNNDVIDTANNKGLLINREKDIMEEGTFVSASNFKVGFFETPSGYFVFDFVKGVVRRAE